MLTEEERRFVDYWKEHRLQRKKWYRQLALGLPLAVILVTAISINFFSNWNKKAEMVRNEMVQKNASLFLVLVVACLAIVVFITLFSVRHKWDINEQRYRELLAREDS